MRKLKIQSSNALAYCFNLLSFLFQSAEVPSKIKAIYVFGSAVRGGLEKGSDIDLFVECAKSDDARVRSLIHSAIVKFTSSQDYEKWKLFKFTYPFSVQVGRLEEWDLKLSIASEGLLLYQIRQPFPSGERMILCSITYPKKKKEYIKLRRWLFGRDESYYRGTGIISEMRGKKISSTVFLIPQHEQTRMIGLLSKKKVDFTMEEIVVLES